LCDGGSACKGVVAVRLARRAKDKMVRIIFSFFGLQFALGGYPGRGPRGSNRRNPAHTVRGSRQKAIATRIFSLTGPTRASAGKNVRGREPRRSVQSRSPESRPRNKIRRRNASSARLDRRFRAAYPCARYDSQRRRGSLQLLKLSGVFPSNAWQSAPFACHRLS